MKCLNGRMGGFFILTRLMLAGLIFLTGILAATPPPSPQDESPAKESLAWQLEEFLQWLIKTRNLTPQNQPTPERLLALNQLTLAGSVDKNAMTFTLTGQMVSDSPTLIPLFNNPRHVILRNVSINGKPAMLGFWRNNCYHVRFAEPSFTIQGELSLVSGYELSVKGPVNLVTAKFSEGALMEGDYSAGVEDMTFHLAPGKKSDGEKSALPPIFLVSRSIRISKEINFEYQVRIRSTEKIPSFTFPLPYGEEVLQVRDNPEVRQEGRQITIPVTAQDTTFTIRGRLKSLPVFEPDTRSNYEWWLIESDPEHQVKIKSDARQMDVSESPIAPQLNHSRLFLVTRGQRIAVEQTELTPMDALAVVVSSQTRQAAWTEKGQLIAWDDLRYENNGVEYLALDCAGKPLYVETDNTAQKILSAGTKAGKEAVMLPLQKGRHNSRIQSISSHKPGLLWGLLKPPNATHPLTISRGYYQLSLPERIIPVWFTGSGFQVVTGPGDLLAALATILLALLFFNGLFRRSAAIVLLAGVYIMAPVLFFAILLTVAGLGLYRVFRAWLLRTKIKKLWLVIGGAGLAAALLFMVWMGMPGAFLQNGGYMEYSKQAPPTAPPDVMQKNDNERSAYKVEGDVEAAPIEAPKEIEEQNVQQQQELDEVYFKAEKNMSRGIIPVALPMPGDSVRTLNASVELVTPDQPFSPTLFYVTRTAMIPLLALWLASLLVIFYSLWPFFRSVYDRLKHFKENSAGGDIPTQTPDSGAKND